MERETVTIIRVKMLPCPECCLLEAFSRSRGTPELRGRHMMAVHGFER